MVSRKPVKTSPTPKVTRTMIWRISKDLKSEFKPYYDMLHIQPIGDRKKRPYKKVLGGKDIAPCTFEFTQKGAIHAYAYKDNWKEWLVKQLVKYGLPDKHAKMIVDNLALKTTSSHIVLDFLQVPPSLVGKKFQDNVSGVTIKFGDESHPDNIEIEVSHNIEREFETIREDLRRSRELWHKPTRQDVHEIKEGVKELLSIYKYPDGRTVFSSDILSHDEIKDLYVMMEKQGVSAEALVRVYACLSHKEIQKYVKQMAYKVPWKR